MVELIVSTSGTATSITVTVDGGVILTGSHGTIKYPIASGLHVVNYVVTGQQGQTYTITISEAAGVTNKALWSVSSALGVTGQATGQATFEA